MVGDVDILLEKLSDRLKLVSKEFDIDDDEIIYRDPYQIVISWETYERHKDKHEHQEIPEIDKDLIICTVDGITDDEIICIVPTVTMKILPAEE